MSMPFFQGRRIYRKEVKAASSPSQRSQAGTPKASAAPSSSQWLTAVKPSKTNTRSDPKPTRLTQEKLIFPGEAGSGIATPKASAPKHKGTVNSTQTTSGNVKKRNPSAGTLDAYYRPREPLAPSQSTNGKHRQSSCAKGRPALAFRAASQNDTDKETSVHVIEDESQVECLDFKTSTRLEQQQQRHIDATCILSSEPDPDLLSDRSDGTSENNSLIRTHHVVPVEDVQPTYNLPPMPLPMIPVPQCLKSVFGFGEAPPPKPAEPEKSKKRKRAVVESSSPVKPATLLAGPSSPATMIRSDPIESEDGVATILAEETMVPIDLPEEQAVIANIITRVEGHGDRIAWGTQDDSEYRRLNRTESERLVDEQLVKRRGPREALPATQLRTDYMDRYRSESYSPIQSLTTDTQMDEFRRRMGMSPLKRKAPAAHASSQLLPVMDLDDEAIQISEPPSQTRVLQESFDESATQHSTASPYLSQSIGPPRHKADDSGFGDSSPKSQAVAKKDVSSDVEGEDLGSSSGEESSFDESTILRKPRERRILALATQETQDWETERVHEQETQLVPCSQEQAESSELDMNFQLDLEPEETETETMRIVKSATSAKKSASKPRQSLSKQIDAAWFPQVLNAATAATASKVNEQEQCMLTDFFNKKPGGPAEKAAAEKAAREKIFANAVFKQRRESRTLLPKALKPGNVPGDDLNDDIEVDDEAEQKADIGEVSDSDTEEASREIESQSVDVRLPCEGWVLGQKRHKTPTPVKQYRYRHVF